MTFQVVKAKQPARAPAESVSVRCGEEKVTVAVKKNFLGNECPLAAEIDPSRLFCLSEDDRAGLEA